MTDLNTETIAVLRKARDLITGDGKWVAGHREHEGAHCALGAIDAVTKNYMRGNEGCEPPKIALDAAIPSEVKAEMVAGKREDPHNYSPPEDLARERVARIACYNNTSDQVTVLRWFDDAVAILEEHPMQKVS